MTPAPLPAPGLSEEKLAELLEGITWRFATFGGGHVNTGNPISVATKDMPLMFSASVDVAEVVKYVAAVLLSKDPQISEEMVARGAKGLALLSCHPSKLTDEMVESRKHMSRACLSAALSKEPQP